MRGSDFTELRAFAAIVEHGSFARAAAHLGITPSTLSAILRRLEERLGTRLLHRTTRSLAPSAAGERLLHRLGPALAALEAAEREAREGQAEPAGLLRLNASRIAAVRHLAPLLGGFLASHPAIRVEVTVEDRLVDIVAGRFDAGIRLGERLHRDMVAVRLGGDLVMKVVAAPDYLARHGRPGHPRDLARHACLAYRNPSDGSPYRWEFERGVERLEVAVEGPLIVDEPAMLPDIACAGAGIAYQFAHQVDAMIAAGRLVQLLPDWTPPFPGFHVYYPSGRQMAPPLRAFLDHLARARLG